MAENLASHGYIVASVDHWDAWGFVWDDGQVYKRIGNAVLDLRGIDERVQDLVFVLNELVNLNDHDPLLLGAFDTERVAVSGFSYGGPTAGEFCRIDARCLAAITFDYGAGDPAGLVTPGLQKPSLMLNSRNNGTSILYDRAAQNAYWMQVTGMEHNDFSSWYWYLWEPPSVIEDKRIAWRAMHSCILSFLNRYLKGEYDELLDSDISTLSNRLVNYRHK